MEKLNLIGKNLISGYGEDEAFETGNRSEETMTGIPAETDTVRKRSTERLPRHMVNLSMSDTDWEKLQEISRQTGVPVCGLIAGTALKFIEKWESENGAIKVSRPKRTGRKAVEV